MKIWLINPYGPIPTEAWRTYCFALIGETLSNNNHEVIWWTSNFSHHFKNWRSDGWQDIKINENFKIRLVPTPGYKKNISIGRIVRDLVFAFRTYFRGKKESSPDCIIFSESPLSFGYAGFKLAQFHKCPCINHQMDLWPEFFVSNSPFILRPFLRVILLPVYIGRRKVFSAISASTALAKPLLEMGFKEAPTLKLKPNTVIYNGIDVNAFRMLMHSNPPATLNLPRKNECDVWAVFAGSLGPSYDITALCEAANALQERLSHIHIIVAGDGPLKAYVELNSSNSNESRLHYVGQLSPVDLASLYARCDIGICAYSAASTVDMPDKFYDYTAAGLAVLSSLKGEVKEIIAENDVGLNYEAGNSKDMVIKLVEISNDRKLLSSMKKRSYNIGLIYDQKNQYEKLIPVIDKLILR